MCSVVTSAKEVLFSSLFVCLFAGIHEQYLLNHHEKKSEDGSWFNLDPINFQIDLDPFLDTKINNPDFPTISYYMPWQRYALSWWFL